MEPKITKLNYTYKKEGADVWVLNSDDIPIDKDKIKDQQIVHLAPQSVGGNHKHPRIEWFIAVGDLQLIWIDELGERHKEHMHPNGQIILFEIPPFLPHAVRNLSRDKSGVLFEFADGKMKDVEKIDVSI
jgi:uncharacterized RmlC-like cupin family protein